MHLSAELIGAIAWGGWPAKSCKGQGFGLVGDIWIVGAFIAGWLFPQLGLHLGAGDGGTLHVRHAEPPR